MLQQTFKGKNAEGPRILLIAGIHGDEITPVYVLSQMIKKRNFNTSNISKLTILNGVNVTGLRAGTREMQFGGSNDLNRSLINDPELDINLIQLLEDQIEEHDIIIDIHSSPSCANFALIDVDEYAKSIASYCVSAGITTAFRYSGGDTIKKYCISKGKIGITYEINKMNKIDFGSADVAMMHISSLLELAPEAHLSILHSDDIPVLQEVATYKEGLVILNVDNGEYVQKSDLLCTITDLESKEILKIRARESGYIIVTPTRDYVKRGEVLFLLQPV